MKNLKLLLGLLTLSSILLAAPKLVNYQGYLTDTDGNPTNGEKTAVFKVWDDSTAGNVVWAETHSIVKVTDGVFNVILGSISPLALDFDKGYWLEITIDGDKLLPRQQVVGNFYSLRSNVADSAVKAANAVSAQHAEVADSVNFTSGDWEVVVIDTNLNTVPLFNQGIDITPYNQKCMPIINIYWYDTSKNAYIGSYSTEILNDNGNSIGFTSGGTGLFRFVILYKK